MSATGGLPILGALSPVARALVLATVAVSFVTIVLDWGLGADPTLTFVTSAVAILGLAWLVGLSTERLGALTGPQVGGILNATFGNIAELIIAFFALQAGLIEVVKASLTGSIIGNLLLVLGASVLVRRHPQRHPALRPPRRGLERGAPRRGRDRLLRARGLRPEHRPRRAGTITEESVLVAGILIVGYVLSLVFQFTNSSRTLGGHEPAAEHGGPAWSRSVAIVVLLAAAGLLAVLSEILVGSIEPFIETFGLSEIFVGVILIPTIGNLAEHLVAVQLAWKNRMEFSMAVAYGSSLQVALFVGPVLVILGAVMGQPMNLVFTPLEIVAVGAAVGISALIALDGESNWLEGALLVIVYVILAVSFFELR